MHDLKQFRPVLYTVLFLGMTGFFLSAEAGGLWGFCALALGINFWLVKTRRFSPLPRWLAGAITILALAWIMVQFRGGGGPPILYIGQFLSYLQLVKLYEQRENRDFAQMLVLSLLLMIAASISTASLLFGAVMVVYLILALYCCLLFHLKIEADRAKDAFPVPPDKVNPSTIQQDRRYFASSMRRLTFLVWSVSVILAVLVFLFFPRGPGQGILGQLQFRPPMSMTGFADRVSFDQINRIKQNDQIVAHVTVWRDGKRVEGTEPLMLRGLALDAYRVDSTAEQKPQWSRSRATSREREIVDQPSLRTYLPSNGPIYRQKVMLEPTSTRYLFALPGLLNFRSDRGIPVRYSAADESLQSVDPINSPLEYTVDSTNEPTRPDSFSSILRQALAPPPASDPAVLSQIREYALRPEVTDGLAAQRSRLARPIDPSNEIIARKIEIHLKSQFAYTLDLTGSRHEFDGSDPIVTFLTKVKKGHCEYFASSMALMCQSLGIPARVVVGFRCDDYNVVGQYYIVRQSHAHTWVEVLTPRGWVSFDPTSGREDRSTRASGVWASVKHFMDFLEYKWAENVIAYNTGDRRDLLTTLDNAMTQSAIDTSFWMARIPQWFNDLFTTTTFWTASLRALTGLIALMIAAIIVIVVWYVAQTHRLRRRAFRIGFATLPRGQQMRLARQLAFYDLLTRVLHRHEITRTPAMTPMEFAESLVYLPSGIYQTIRRLTHLFYRVRFGDTQLNPHRQRRLEQLVWRLSDSLEQLTHHPHTQTSATATPQSVVRATSP